jgi:hypothetical protein
MFGTLAAIWVAWAAFVALYVAIKVILATILTAVTIAAVGVGIILLVRLISYIQAGS